MYSVPCSCGKEYKYEISRPIKVKLEEHRKAVMRRETMKSGMADHVWRKIRSHQPLGNEIKILYKE